MTSKLHYKTDLVKGKSPVPHNIKMAWVPEPVLVIWRGNNCLYLPGVEQLFFGPSAFYFNIHMLCIFFFRNLLFHVCHFNHALCS